VMHRLWPFRTSPLAFSLGGLAHGGKGPWRSAQAAAQDGCRGPRRDAQAVALPRIAARFLPLSPTK
jgi:hypothetical protein